MNKKGIYLIILTIFVIILIAYIFVFLKKGGNDMQVIDGDSKERKLPGYSDNIKSKNIVSFEYNNPEYHLECKKENNIINIKAKGGYSNERDGKYFKLDYNTKNNNFLNELQNIIDKYNVSKNNGYENEVAGLPPDLGDDISVIYDTKEKIWKYSNQFFIIDENAQKEFYNLFLTDAKENGYDFNSKGSNVKLYDDADQEFLQGKWKGTNFGKEYIVEFKNDDVKIYEDGKLIDDTKYIIIDGDIVKNKLKEGITNPKNRYDYEEFSIISTIKKKNNILLTAYFMKDSYSTCELLKEGN